MNEALRAYDRAARDLHETELRITSISFRGQSGVDSKILPSLIAKRDRLVNDVIALKGPADDAKQQRHVLRQGTHIKFRDQEWFAIGTGPIEDVIGPMPDFLKRARA